MTERKFGTGEYEMLGGGKATVTSVCADGLAGSICEGGYTQVATWRLDGSSKAKVNPSRLALTWPTGHKFDLGEYVLRNGHRAVVCGILPGPNDSLFVLAGFVQCRNGKWWMKTWRSSGRMCIDADSEYDLMPREEVTYRRVPCMDCVCWCDERSKKPICGCEHCRVERITRRDGKVVSVELETSE